eukprot:SAG25_NODE_4650_length_775_cov_0.979290_2_plen_34_part_01
MLMESLPVAEHVGNKLVELKDFVQPEHVHCLVAF